MKLHVMNNLSTKMTNTIKTNVSINSDDKIVRYCFISYTVLLVIILTMIIAIICYNYLKHTSK